MLATSEILQIYMRPLLAKLRSRSPRATLAPQDLAITAANSSGVTPERCDVLATLQKLPPLCLTRSKATHAVIAIRRGELGYYLVDAPPSPEEFNRRNGITPDQIVAMENGALLGWEVPEADPDIVRAQRLARAAQRPAILR